MVFGEYDPLSAQRMKTASSSRLGGSLNFSQCGFDIPLLCQLGLGLQSRTRPGLCAISIKVKG